MRTRLCLFAASACIALCAASAASQTDGPCSSTVVGNLQKRTFTSTTFGDTQTLRIWLPAGYNDPANAQRHYPVLYMLDGEKLFDVCTSSFHHERQGAETLTKLISDGEME